MKDTDWAYLAGIIDGEGCISWVIGPKNRLGQPRVNVSMSTKQPTLWIYKKFGGKYRKRWVLARGVTPQDGWRYYWGIYSHDGVYLILEGCLPFLKTKRKKAKEVMLLCRSEYRTVS